METIGAVSHTAPETTLPTSSLTFHTLISKLPSGTSSTETSHPSEPAAEVGHSTPSTGKSWWVASQSKTKAVESRRVAMITLVCLLLGSFRGSKTEYTLLRVPRSDLPGSAMARASRRLNRRSSATLHIDEWVFAVSSTARMATAMPPMMSTIQCMPR